MINNTIIEANKQGRKATVFALAHPALYMIEMAAHVGFDAISIDGEHGGFPEEAIDDICRTANGYGMSVIARVPDNAAYQINLYLCPRPTIVCLRLERDMHRPAPWLLHRS